MINEVVHTADVAYIVPVKGNELRERRKALKLTQEQLAAKLEVASNTVARWERDEMAIPPYLKLALETVERNLTATRAAESRK